MTIEDDLRQSMQEEAQAVVMYRARASSARASGDEATAKLWEHIAEEEDGHYNEFKDRLTTISEDRTVARRLTEELVGGIKRPRILPGDLVKSRAWQEGEDYPWLTVKGGPYATSWLGQPMNEYKVTNGITENNVFEDTIFDHIPKHREIPHMRPIVPKSEKYRRVESQQVSGVYVTVSYQGDTTFNIGDTVSAESFDEENKRVRHFGGKEARGEYHY